MKALKKLSAPLLLALPLMASQQATAADLTVEVTNLTHSIYFTPLLISAHSSDSDLFEVGQPASDTLEAMAEGGMIGGLVADLNNANAVNVTNPAGGLLAPTASATTQTFDVEDNGYLSIVAMLLPTNDGFVGLDSWKIPSEAGSYTVYLNAYDAGTEANNELIIQSNAVDDLGIPQVQGVNSNIGGTNDITEENDNENNNVHIHRGTHGDTNATGGISDLDSRVHRWLNPVAKVVITVSDSDEQE
jgi:hypothetical protein